MVASPESIVHGIVLVDGERYAIAIRSEFLFIDALAWFEHQRKKHLELAKRGTEEGDEEFATEMREVADQVAELVRAGRPLNQPGIWPQIRNRSLVQPWRVEDDHASVRSYLKSLIEFGVASDAENPIFLVRCDDGGELLATERLRAQVRFAGPFAAKLVDCEEILRRLSDLSRGCLEGGRGREGEATTD